METRKLFHPKEENKWRVARILVAKGPVLIFSLHTLPPSVFLHELCCAWEIQLQSQIGTVRSQVKEEVLNFRFKNALREVAALHELNY